MSETERQGGTMPEIKNGKDNWKSAIENAKGHFDQAFRELGHAAEQAKSQGQEAWQNAQEKARETWEDVREKGTVKWEETRERGEELLKDGQNYVRGNPTKSVGISALVGLLLGIVLFSGRDRD